MKNKNAAFSFTAIEMIDEEGKFIKSKRKIKKVVDYNILLKIQQLLVLQLSLIDILLEIFKCH